MSEDALAEFVTGLAAHVGGYVLRSSATTEPLVLVADLLYAAAQAGAGCL